MKLFETIESHGHEQVVACHDKSSGYKGIIAIHNTTLGPALGGTRFWNYASDDEAFFDVLRLARGMTYKNAVAGLNLGVYQISKEQGIHTYEAADKLAERRVAVVGSLTHIRPQWPRKS
jgi:glutamate dehydrogenase/leucine dehydrogenase